MSNPLGPLYSIEFVVCVLCAVAWYKAADVENVSPWLWVGMCVGVYALTWLWLGRGLLGILLAQVGLLVAVGAARAWLSHRRGGG